MKLRDLEAEFRGLVDDEVMAKPLWSKAEVASYATAAQVDACERAHLIEDDRTAGVCTIIVREDVGSYPLSPLIQRIESARLDSQDGLLALKHTYDLDRERPNWRTRTGTPWALADQGTKAYLVWIPTADDVLRLTVKRLPCKDLKDANDEPEIPESLHRLLLDGMLERAYLKRDSETYNPQKSAVHAARFTDSFGERPDAGTRRRRRERRTHIMKPGPYA